MLSSVRVDLRVLVTDYICWRVSLTVTTVQYRSNASLEPRTRSNTDRELASPDSARAVQRSLSLSTCLP